MNYIHNPFVLFGYDGPEYFCDRQIETEQLTSSLRNGRNITLTAPRRMGKTTLIKHVFNRIGSKGSGVYCFYMDIFATHSLADFVSLFGRTVIGRLDSSPEKALGMAAGTIRSARLVFSADMMGQSQVSLEFLPQYAEEVLGEIFEYMRRSGKECYVAIDEFQQLVEYAETGVEALLRSYVEQCPNVRFIFSGSKQDIMDDIFSNPRRPFYRSTEKMRLSVISEESYYSFARKHMLGAGKKLSIEVFHYVYSLFGGHTWYVQNILNHLYECSSDCITNDDVLQCVNRIVESESEEYKKHYASLTQNQAYLLRAIAKEGCVGAINSSAFIQRYSLKGSSSVNKALAFLLDNEYVCRSDKGYIVYDRFMNIWLSVQ
jgi:AAA+ ATPase superfamily predicted ATPase